MMGKSHALSGAAVWLAGSAVAAHHWQVHQSAAQLAIGTALCAGGSLQNDWDLSGRVTSCQGGATVARTFGVASLFVAECVEKLSLGVYNATKTRKDPPRSDGHRTATHTLPFTLGLGGGVFALCARFGRWAVLPVLFLMLACAMRALFGAWVKRSGWLVTTGTAAGLTAVAFPFLPDNAASYRLLGLAVGVGALVHLLGDMCTTAGCPILWPIPVGGRMWRMVGLPVLRCKTGGTGERVWAAAFSVTAALSGAALMFPATTNAVLAQF